MLMALAIVLCANLAAQENQKNDSLHLVKAIDEMDGKTYYYTSKRIVLTDDNSQKGFSVELSLSGANDNAVKPDGIMVKMAGMGCCENSTIIFLLDNEEKISLKSWNKFNCNGNAWFKITPKQIQSLQSNKVLKIKVENGHNFQSLTKETEEWQQDYFQRVGLLLKDKVFEIKIL